MRESPFYRTVKTVLTCRVELLTTEAADRTAASSTYLDRARFARSARTLFLTDTDHEIRVDRSLAYNPEGDLR